ncbi:hypothetical protein K402DRAFT_397388 [Aulographum hederae CBS 113979]|uniref:Uncharacterized protein n=1 Tax=Aulographum hederae CBS 113979 TaxID=1176131 RepID=A0A6G1GNZ5_9PEZI|nr:hypothetical protein K402DRAFT_397388 [Aulographum hederae CBS 113979]
MRATTRLLATVKTARFPQAGTPTGLKGLLTQPIPRKTLRSTYFKTLRVLAMMPSHSVYRQATQALTLQRLAVLESYKPAGYKTDSKDEVMSAEEINAATTPEQRDKLAERLLKAFVVDEEPPLTVDQISEIEDKIGAGLIEEVLEVGQAELQLAEMMAVAKPWEELVEKPAEGQWEYFSRQGAHTATQKP